jgi:transformation/transcription domain-associated protein
MTVGIDPKAKLTPAMELRDNVEFLCTGSSYPIFLKKLLPIFVKILEGPPVFISTSWVQVRNKLYISPICMLPKD